MVCPIYRLKTTLLENFSLESEHHSYLGIEGAFLGNTPEASDFALVQVSSDSTHPIKQDLQHTRKGLHSKPIVSTFTTPEHKLNTLDSNLKHDT